MNKCQLVHSSMLFFLITDVTIFSDTGHHLLEQLREFTLALVTHSIYTAPA